MKQVRFTFLMSAWLASVTLSPLQAQTFDELRTLASRDPAQAIAKVDQLLATSTTPEREAELRIAKARALYGLGKLQEALGAFRTAREVSKNGPARLEAEALRGIGSVLQVRGDLRGALAANQDSLERAITSGDPQLIYRANNNIGAVSSLMGDLAGASAGYGRAYEIMKRMAAASPNDQVIQRDLGIMALNFGGVELQRNRNKEAERLMRNAAAVGTKMNEKLLYFNAQVGLGAALRQQKRIEEALVVVRPVLRNAENITIPLDRMRAYELGTNLFLDAGQPKAALAEAEKAVAVARSIKPKSDYALSQALERRARAQKALNDVEKALVDAQAAGEATRSAYGSEKASAMAELEARYKAAERQQKITEMAALDKQKEAALKRQNLIIIAVSIIAALFLALLGLLFNIARLRWQTNDALKASHDEISRQAAQLTEALADRSVLLRELDHRVGNNLNVITSLVGLQLRRLESNPKDASGAQRAFREIERRLQAMALIHRTLAIAKHKDQIALKPLLQEIGSCVFQLFDSKATLQVDGDNPEVTTDVAIPLGLITCELASNALEHGQLAGSNWVKINLQTDANELIVSISNNGKPMISNFALERAQSLGLTIVKDLSRQLYAELIVEQRDDEVCWTISVPCDFASINKMHMQ